MTGLPAPETFLSGEHGEVGGRRGALRRAADRMLDRQLGLAGALARIDSLDTPARTILATGVYRPPAQPPALHSSRHSVRAAFGPMRDGVGKFENLNALLSGERADWTIVVDDDVVLPERFLDRFVAVCEHFRLDLAQPAQTLASHAAWRVVRRRPFSLARETRFVEIGPVTAFSRRAGEALLPFPPLRYGWGLDLHWSALAAARGWRLGIVDALPVRHESSPVGAGYSSGEAIDEAQRFLADRPYLQSGAVGDVLAVHR